MKIHGARDERLKLLEEADVPCAPIITPAEVFDHPQIVENELIVEVDDPRVGKVKMMGIPLSICLFQAWSLDIVGNSG